MIITSKTTNFYSLDMWEAWIDLLDGANQNATLYVVGSIFWQESRIKPALVKRTIQEHPQELQLEIRPGVFWDHGPLREIRYSMDLKDASPFRRVSIYIGNELVYMIQTIEKLE